MSRKLKASWTPDLAADMNAMHGSKIWDKYLERGPMKLEVGQTFHPPGMADRLYMVMKRDDLIEEYIIYSFTDQQEYIHKVGFSTEIILVNLKD